ncbi:MAG: hypothetical protein ACI9KE_004727 [Polyangiales bacterium]|jgi:CRISPR/Cas system-associated endonuclease Cas3-HD
MIDVAAVAEVLCRDCLPSSTRDALLAPFQKAEDPMGSLMLCVALHDLGKATPTFQQMTTPPPAWR